MRRNLFACLAVVLLASPFARSDEADPEGRAMLQRANRAIAAYHSGEPRSPGKLRIVYFVPSDGDPLADYRGRLDRAMNDFDAFLRAGFQRFGLEPVGIPLERSEGQVVLHLVRGKLPANQYHHLSGDVTRAEIREALQGTFDIDREHVLVFYALCRREADGRYVFDAPYYGSGTQRSGFCHAADCERLDPLLLREVGRQMVYTEHYYPRVEQSVAEFNTRYLGGTIHELGHCLNLPHDNGSAPERRFGVSLMGVGNLDYRRDVWGGGPTAYLARATALRLAAQPLITGSDRGRWTEADGRFEALGVEGRPGSLRIKATVAGTVPAYAAIASTWPDDARNDDHYARTFPVVLGEGGSLTLDLDGLPPGAHHLTLAGLHANGAATTQPFSLVIDATGVPDLVGLEHQIVGIAEQAVMAHQLEVRRLCDERARDALKTPAARRELQILRSLVDPPLPINPATAPGDHLGLSDAAWTEARVGWGEPMRNAFWSSDRFRSGVFLRLQGEVYVQGLYAHAASVYAFRLDARWRTFRSTVGLRDGAHAIGSAVFRVIGDGRELGRSRILRVGEKAELTADITGVHELRLETEGGEGHTHNSWAIWAEPEIRR